MTEHSTGQRIDSATLDPLLPPSGPTDPAPIETATGSRLVRLRGVVHDAAERLACGWPVAVDHLIGGHFDLQPELG